MFAHIGITTPTRLFALVRKENWWEMWIMMDPGVIQLPHKEWRGTHLRCWNDGCVERVTVNRDGSEDGFIIKPKDMTNGAAQTAQNGPSASNTNQRWMGDIQEDGAVQDT